MLFFQWPHPHREKLITEQLSDRSAFGGSNEEMSRSDRLLVKELRPTHGDALVTVQYEDEVEENSQCNTQLLKFVTLI